MSPELLAEQYPNHTIEDRSVPIDKLPTWVWVLMILSVLIPMGIFFLFLNEPKNNFSSEWTLIILILGLLLLHEATHAVAWKFSSGLPWSSFKFGVQWKTLSPYCHSKEPMGVVPYRIGTVMPLIITGILPYLFGFLTNNADVVIASSILIGGAAGDLYILWSVRDLPEEALLQDHDKNAGCIVLRPVN